MLPRSEDLVDGPIFNAVVHDRGQACEGVGRIQCVIVWQEGAEFGTVKRWTNVGTVGKIEGIRAHLGVRSCDMIRAIVTRHKLGYTRRVK